MSTREIRYCDVCAKEYDEANPAWMVMMAINTSPEVGEISFDFCAFECLEKWVTTDDDAEVTESGPSTPVEVPEEIQQAAQPTPPRDKPAPKAQAEQRGPVRPPGVPTLAEALAMGLKPDGR